MELNNNVLKKQRAKAPRWAGQLDALGPCILTAVIAAGVFLNSLDGDFVHDDKYAIVNNPDVTGGKTWTELFINDFWGKPMSENSSHKSYRPLTVITFRLNYSISSGDSFWFHIVNTALHSLVTMLFTFVCQDIFRAGRLCSLIAGLLFALHPVHSEAVSGIVGRAELLAAIFFLLAIISYVKSTQYRKHGENSEFPVTQRPFLLVAMVTCTLAAMLSKEHGLTVVGVCGLLDALVVCKKGVRRVMSERTETALMRMSPLMARALILIVVSLCALLFRLWIMAGHFPQFLEQDNPASFSSSLLTRVLTYNYLFAVNAWLLLCPITLCYDWTFGSIPLVESLTDPRNLTTLMLYVVFTLIVLQCVKEFKSQTEPSSSLVLISAILIVLPFLPASNLLFRVGFVIAERILYIPSMGFCLLVGHGISLLLKHFPKYKQHLLTLLVSYLAVLGSKTWNQNYTWMSREALFRSGVVRMPENAKVHFNYGNYLNDAGHLEAAIWHYRKSIQLYPDHAGVHNNLATIVSNRSEAERLYRTALQLYPQHKGALINLGQQLFDRGEREEGLQMAKSSLALDVHSIDALLTMGKMMMELNRMKEAERYLKAAIVEKPSFAKAYNFYGAFFQKQGDVKMAVTYYEQAYTLDNKDAVSMASAAEGMRKLGRMKEAEKLLKRSLAVRSDMKVYDQLALLYFALGRTNDAAVIYEQAVDEATNDTTIMIHYANVLMRQNEVNKAELYVMRILSHHPTHSDALRVAGSIANLKERHNEAEHYLREALTQATAQGYDRSYQAIITFELGNVYSNLKKLDLAAKYYQETLHLDSTKAKAHLNLGAVYHLQAKFKDARLQYEKALELHPDDAMAKQNLVKLEQLEQQQTAATKRGKT